MFNESYAHAEKTGISEFNSDLHAELGKALYIRTRCQLPDEAIIKIANACDCYKRYSIICLRNPRLFVDFIKGNITDDVTNISTPIGGDVNLSDPHNPVLSFDHRGAMAVVYSYQVKSSAFGTAERNHIVCYIP